MSNRYDVCVLRRNDFTVDGRVERQAATLAALGLRVLVLALGGDRLVRHSSPEGFDLERLPIGAGGGLRLGPVDALASGAGPIARRASTLLGTGFYYVEAVRRIVSHRPRVVHCHDLDTLSPGVLGARLVGSRVVYDSAELWTERNSGLLGLRRRLDHLRYSAMERALIGKADAVITVSEGIATELSQRYGIAQPILLRNVPRRPRRSARGTASSLRARIGGDGPIILHLGTVDMNRGLEQTVRALVDLPACRLVLLGPARPYVMEPLRELAMSVGVSERVIHIPPVPRDEIVAWAVEADVGLCTFLPVCLSHILALPNKFFEYAFAGVPMVVSDFPDMGAMVTEYGLGTLCDPDDASDIARSIERILEGVVPRRSPEQVEEFCAAFAWERESEKLVRLYADLLGRPDLALPADANRDRLTK